MDPFYKVLQVAIWVVLKYCLSYINILKFKTFKYTIYIFWEYVIYKCKIFQPI
jgi:hypothetical protein